MKFSAAPPQLPSRSTLVGGVLLLVGVIYAADVLLLQPEHPEKLVASALAILAAPVAWYTLRRGINVFAASTAFLALVYAGYAVFDALSPHNPLAEFLPRSLRGGTLSTRLLGAAVLFALSLRSAWASSRRRAQGDDEDEGEDDAPAGDGAPARPRRRLGAPAGGGAFSQAFGKGGRGRKGGGGAFSSAFGNKRSGRGAFSKAFDSRRGFTLIELMVTMAITALVFAMVGGILISVLSASERVEIELQYEKRGYGALTLIRRDLSGVYAYGLGGIAFKGEDEEQDGRSADTLDFVTTARVLPPDEEGKVPRMIEVGYKLDANDALGDKSLTLFRRAEPFEGDPIKGGDYLELLSGVESFALEYLDPKTQEWVEDWDKPDLLPLAVKITLELVLDEAEKNRAEDAGVDLPPPQYQIVVGISTAVVPDKGEQPQADPAAQQPPPPGGG